MYSREFSGLERLKKWNLNHQMDMPEIYILSQCKLLSMLN